MFTVSEITEVSGGKLLQGHGKTFVRGVATDTRKIRKGELFVAIKGDNFDGHEFTAKAVDAGAAAVLVSRQNVECLARTAGLKAPAVILVQDTVKALGALARAHRSRFRGPVIAITGSAGKTTTKEFVAAVLKKKFDVLCNKGTENNHIGVPMTLLQLNKKHEAAVIEAGTNHHGEIDWLGWIICPTVAVYTNIGESHLAGLGSTQGVLREKAALVKHLTKDGVVVINEDDPCLRQLASRCRGKKIVTYGIDRKAAVQALRVKAWRGGLEVSLSPKESFRLPSPVWGNVYNALAAVVCGKLFEIPFNDTASAMARTKSAKGRQCFHKIHGVVIIDDTYNANPVSYRNAIRTLSLARGKGRTILVGADMLELGNAAESLHRETGGLAGRAAIDHVLTVGRWAGLIGEAAAAVNPGTHVKHVARQEDLLPALKALLQKGDVVLVKGSRGMKMERTVEGLLR